jgi:kumamolisin
MILGCNSNQGLADTFERAIFPKEGEHQNTVVSASWGLAENRQTTMLINTLHVAFKQAAIRGVQVFSGSGDHGARAMINTFQPEYPASDPNVTGVGGLKMILDDQGKLAWAKAWDEGEQSSTGGGVSKIFKLPFWQNRAGVPKNVDNGLVGRGVPDISTNAASATGFPVRVGGKTLVIGGTSAGAPLYGGLMLNINAELAPLGIKPITPLNPWMYARANKGIFHDITSGGNHGYMAGKGWDAVTGLGWVDGTAMLEAMKAGQKLSLQSTLGFLPVGVNAGADQQRVGH